MGDINLYDNRGRFVGTGDLIKRVFYPANHRKPYTGDIFDFEGDEIGSVASNTIQKQSYNESPFVNFWITTSFWFTLGYTVLFYNLWQDLERGRLKLILLYFVGILSMFLIPDFVPLVGPVYESCLAFSGIVVLVLNIVAMLYAVVFLRRPFRLFSFAVGALIVFLGVEACNWSFLYMVTAAIQSLFRPVY